MGVIRFLASPSDRITPDTAALAYMSGFDRVPWQGRGRLDGAELTLERGVSDSGNLQIPWTVEGHGLVMLSTACLAERGETYHLPLEIARGKISQFRNQLAEWQSIGLAVPDSLVGKAAEAQRYFAQAAVASHERTPSVNMAETALRLILDAGEELAECYATQALAVRRRHLASRPCFVGADLGVTPLDETAASAVLGAFDAVRVPLAWREIESSEGTRRWDVFDRQIAWCRAHRLITCGGPLLQLTDRYAPDWLYLFEDDLASLQASVSDFVTATVTRYRGRVDLWQCAGRTNTADFLALSEEELVQLTAHTIEQTRVLDPQTPMVVSFDQPWAEYVSRREVDFPPFYFADALVRANLGIAGFMLEINWGYQPGGTLPRDPLEFSRQLDTWAGLGMPLFIGLCVPGGGGPDAMAQSPSQPIQTDCSPAAQQAWLNRYLPILLSKAYVRGVFWTQLDDRAPHEFAHGGLINSAGQAKPALRTMAAMRQSLL
jgi:hypothetical protein